MLKTVEVNNIRCEGCVNTIKKTLKKEGFSSVDVDLSCEPRKVTINVNEEASEAHAIDILKKLGYPLFEEEISFGNAATFKAKSFISCAVGKFNIKDDTN